MLSKNSESGPNCCQTLFMGISAFMVIGSIVGAIYSIIMLIDYKINKIHGVHETYFSFNGLYKITTDHDSYKNVVFVTNCNCDTPYGNCYYEYYDNLVYQFAVDYGEKNCNNRTLNGFISTETHKCTLDNPNYDMYPVSIMLKSSVSVLILYILGVYFYKKINKSNEIIKKEITEELKTIEEKIDFI